MNKHTPGPWRLCARPDPRRIQHQVAGTDGYLIATIAGQNDPDVHDANARLIVLAPVLLAQLKDITRRFYLCAVVAGNSPEFVDEAVRAARAVMWKAHTRHA